MVRLAYDPRLAPPPFRPAPAAVGPSFAFGMAGAHDDDPALGLLSAHLYPAPMARGGLLDPALAAAPAVGLERRGRQAGEDKGQDASREQVASGDGTALIDPTAAARSANYGPADASPRILPTAIARRSR